MKIDFSETQLLMKYIEVHPDFTSVMVDVGAHVGLVSRHFAEKNWRVVAFEPEPYNHQKLQDAIGKYENVSIINKAISTEVSGEIEFYVSSKHYGIHSLQPFHESHTETIKVETCRLDSTLAELQIDRVGYLKIDIEGADFLALQSFDFARIKPQLVMVEFMDERSQANFDYGYRDMVEYMQQFGYITMVSEWAEIEAYSIEGREGDNHRFIRCEAYPIDSEPAWGNLIFIPESDARLFQSVLDDYLATRIRHARGTARKKWIEQLPGGRHVYQLARRLYHLFVD